MKVAILTAYNAAYKGIAEVTLPVMQRYAQAHGYGLHVGEYKEDPHDLPNYGDRGKIGLYLQHYDAHDILVWLDIDVLITNHETRVEHVLGDRPFLWTYDANGPCSGFWIARCEPLVAIMFNKVRAEAQLSRGVVVKESWKPHNIAVEVEPHGTSDQTTMRSLMHLPPYADVLRYCVSGKEAGHCYDYRIVAWPEAYDHLGHWERGDWLYTLPSIELVRRRVLLARKAVELGLASGAAQE